MKSQVSASTVAGITRGVLALQLPDGDLALAQASDGNGVQVLRWHWRDGSLTQLAMLPSLGRIHRRALEKADLVKIVFDFGGVLFNWHPCPYLGACVIRRGISLCRSHKLPCSDAVRYLRTKYVPLERFSRPGSSGHYCPHTEAAVE